MKGKLNLFLSVMMVLPLFSFNVFAQSETKSTEYGENIEQSIKQENEIEEIKKEFFSRFEESHLYTNDEVKEYFELIGEPVLEVEDEINENYTVVIPATSSPGTWFTWRKWINRNGIWSSLLMPGLGKVHVIKRYPDRAWSFIYSRHYNSRQWQFYAPEADKSMELQFKYHLYLAQGFKVPWNLEPHKKVKDVKWHCN